jgi:hypothetical protein
MRLFKTINPVKTTKYSRELIVTRTDKDILILHVREEESITEQAWPIVVYENFHAILQDWCPDLNITEHWRISGEPVKLARNAQKTLGWII